MFLYKLCYIDEQTDIFDEIEILTDEMLRRRFKNAVIEGQLTEETIAAHNLSADTDFEEIELCDIMDIFDEDGYDIQQIEIDDPEYND